MDKCCKIKDLALFLLTDLPSSIFIITLHHELLQELFEIYTYTEFEVNGI